LVTISCSLTCFNQILTCFIADPNDNGDGDDDSDSDEEVAGPSNRRGRKKALFELRRDERGNPLLPILDSTPALPTLKKIIRAMFTAAYSMST